MPPHAGPRLSPTSNRRPAHRPPPWLRRSCSASDGARAARAALPARAVFHRPARGSSRSAGCWQRRHQPAPRRSRCVPAKWSGSRGRCREDRRSRPSRCRSRLAEIFGFPLGPQRAAPVAAASWNHERRQRRQECDREQEPASAFARDASPLFSPAILLVTDAAQCRPECLMNPSRESIKPAEQASRTT